MICSTPNFRFRAFSVCCMAAIILLALQAQAAHGTENETERAFHDGIRYYKEGNFAGAVSEFSRIAGTGLRNAKLFYNLGNAYLKNGELGYAILWYERALKLGGDPDLRFNHRQALDRVTDEKDSRDASVFRILFFWKHFFSPETVRSGAIVLNLIFWLLIAVRTLRRRKRILRASACLILISALVFTLTAFYNYYEAAYLRHAVILPPEVSVRSGLSDSTTELFVLHAGTKVKLEEEDNDHFKIYFSEGKIGWIKKTDAGLI